MTEPSSSQLESGSKVIYSERQWVPWYWWIIGIGAAALIALQLWRNRDTMLWFIGPLLFFAVFAIWGLWYLSSTVLTVEQDGSGVRWLRVSGASLPSDVVSRSMAVPASAKRNAMGRQLDPAAFVASKSWIPELVMLVLDDPEDPTPYWLVSTRRPHQVIEAFVGKQPEA